VIPSYFASGEAAGGFESFIVSLWLVAGMSVSYWKTVVYSSS
jgi:hypothetical protein